jgi:DNA-binding response OmpR family regulator
VLPIEPYAATHQASFSITLVGNFILIVCRADPTGTWSKLTSFRVRRSVTLIQAKKGGVLMGPTVQQVSHRVLLVDDDHAVLDMMNQTLRGKGYEVVAVASVNEALKQITTASFDVLITDLHMPNPGDGFTVISAMRHSQPNALTLLVSGYPDVQSAMACILLEADEIVVKPFDIKQLAELVNQRMSNRKATVPTGKERVGAILQRCSTLIIEDWLRRAKQSSELNHLRLSDDQRTGHLGKLVDDLAVRLSLQPDVIKDSDAEYSPAASNHGKLRFSQGYTPTMLIHESRILQVTIFGMLQKNLGSIDFSLLLPDVMTIADEVDAQLTQTMESYMKLTQSPLAVA